ncbi:MAG: DUF4326 domain-containing protein [Candidatus Paceibacterota bacterium]
MINVANVRYTKYSKNDPTVIYVGRKMKDFGGSVLGNPYKINKQDNVLDTGRDKVIRKYKMWLLERMKDKESDQFKEMIRLKRLSEAGNLTLLCWCWPLHCHGDVIKEILESM